jgi:hypothetical protein
MMAAEEYTAHHAESLKTIMYEWPWRRFEGMFRRHLLRKAREELRQMRDLRIAVLDANTNYDAKDNQQAKQERVEGYQQAYLDAVRVLYSDPNAPEPQDAFDDDPLFNPLRQRAQQLRTEANEPLAPQSGMGQKLLAAT